MAKIQVYICIVLLLCLIRFHGIAQMKWPPRKDLTQEQYLIGLIDSLTKAEEFKDTADIINYAAILTTEFQLAAMKERAAAYLHIAFRYAEAYSDPTWYAEVCNRAGILTLTLVFRGSYPWSKPQFPHMLDSAMYWHRLAIRTGLESGNSYAVGNGYRYMLQYAVYKLSFNRDESVKDSIPIYYDKAIKILSKNAEHKFDINTHYIKYLTETGEWQKAETILKEQLPELNQRSSIRKANFLYVLHDYLAKVNQLDTLTEIRQMLLDNYEEQIAAQHSEQLYAKDQLYEVSKTKSILNVTASRLKVRTYVLVVVLVGLAAFTLLIVYLFFLFRKNKRLSQRNELLLREQNHRVKNNLQMISSLLSLQSQKLISSEVKNALEESQSRINSVGLLHRMLYQGENLGCIEVIGYIRSLVDEIQYSAGREVQLNLHFPEKLEMQIEKVTSLGLIINELLTNSIKHIDSEIKLHVEMVLLADSARIYFKYKDNGPGVDPEVWMSSDSFGNLLVRIQSQQLKGEFEVKGDDGFSYELKISA